MSKQEVFSSSFCMCKILFLFILLLMFCAFSTGAVSAAPVDGVSDSIVSSDATPQEVRLGRKSVEEIESRLTVLVNPVHQARVETIVGRLRPYMERNLPYEVRIIDHEMVNAFALAGGMMYVSTGMLDFVRTDLELAGVIAHEMVHADRKHVITQVSRNNRMTLLAIAAAIASKGKGAALIATSAVQVAVMGAYSIDLEKEADAYGIEALVKAGYNPVGMLTLQERLRDESIKHPNVDPGIFRTHPESKERIAAAAKYMEERNIPIQRKYSLAVLRTDVDVVSDDLALLMDDKPIWRGADDEQTRALFRRVADDLWQHLQLETAPYDIRVEMSRQGETFMVEGRTIAAKNELPPGTQPLADLREGVQAAINAARQGYFSDYYM